MTPALYAFVAVVAVVGAFFGWLAMDRGAQHDRQPVDGTQVPAATTSAVPSPPVNFAMRVSNMADSIAKAEGFGLPDAIPTLAHNPGDLVLGDIGYGTLGTEKITVCASDADGRNRLVHQVTIMLAGISKVYSTGDTFADVAQKWTRNDPASWARNVADYLGASPSTTLADYAAGNF